MSTATIVTITKMLETLPEPQQERVAEHLREYLKDLKDEIRWDKSFEKASSKLSKFARKARQEIAEGQSEPMNFNRL